MLIAMAFFSLLTPTSRKRQRNVRSFELDTSICSYIFAKILHYGVREYILSGLKAVDSRRIAPWNSFTALELKKESVPALEKAVSRKRGFEILECCVLSGKKTMIGRLEFEGIYMDSIFASEAEVTDSFTFFKLIPMSVELELKMNHDQATWMAPVLWQMKKTHLIVPLHIH